MPPLRIRLLSCRLACVGFSELSGEVTSRALPSMVSQRMRALRRLLRFNQLGAGNSPGKLLNRVSPDLDLDLGSSAPRSARARARAPRMLSDSLYEANFRAEGELMQTLRQQVFRYGQELRLGSGKSKAPGFPA